ncbi:MAG: hypothetical protein ACXV8A_01085, partial [Chthoniobacterales bacterium]
APCVRLASSIAGPVPHDPSGEIGRRARLRIAILPISRHRFSFQNRTLLRGQIDHFDEMSLFLEWRLETASF